MPSPPLSEFTSFYFQGTSLDSSWHGISPLDSSAESIVLADTPLNYSPSTTSQWNTRSLRKASLQLDTTGTVVQVVEGGDATPVPGWED